MYKTCPKCKYIRQPTDNIDPDICPDCGIHFSKWMKQQFSPKKEESKKYRNPDTSKTKKIIGSYLFYTEEKVNPFVFFGRILVFIGLLIWGLHFINVDFTKHAHLIMNSYMHIINLVFHEAGHVIFRPFGWFITILGGTLGQLLMPIIVILTFLIKNRNNFGASVGLWWLGQSFIDCAPYIDDAAKMQLQLVGGGTGWERMGSHDWNNMLIEIGELDSHREIATTFDTIGTLIILLALFWSAYLLFKQFKKIDSI